MEQEQNVLEGWSKEDKYHLLLALKNYGSSCLNVLSDALPNKSQDEIKQALKYYKEKAMKHPIVVEKRKTECKPANTIPRIPLASWAKRLTDSYTYEELQTEVVDALRLIAELEAIPSPVCTENIDFRSIYHLLANAIEGKALPYDKLSALVVDKCLMETALLTKSFIRSSTLKMILDNIDAIDNTNINNFAKPLDNHELAAVNHLAMQLNYNPLRIPVEYLKPHK